MPKELGRTGPAAADVRKVMANGPAARFFVTTKLPWIEDERIFVMTGELADEDENVDVTEISDS
jgi:hypothetical protein